MMAIRLEDIPDIPPEGFLRLNIKWVKRLPKVIIGPRDKNQAPLRDPQDPVVYEIETIVDDDYFLLEKKAIGNNPSIIAYGRIENLTYANVEHIPLNDIIRIGRVRIDAV